MKDSVHKNIWIFGKNDDHPSWRGTIYHTPKTRRRENMFSRIKKKLKTKRITSMTHKNNSIHTNVSEKMK